ncbi:MAG TPA: aldehyde dehydrogenase family protein [Solirubrobacteraceae bacterium]|nr:aldehyde dehydrogenase family protein [Solirubrobacteraceae bacterium]
MATATEQAVHVWEKIYIGGEWVKAGGDGMIEVINSTTEQVIGSVADATTQDVDAAVAAARSAFESWSATPLSERADWMAKIGQALGARAEEIAALIAQEVGMPLKLSAMIQAGLPTTTFNSMPKLLEEFAWEEQIGSSLIVREPIGVVAAITPWNYPLHQIAAKVAPALAAGCTVVLKPSQVAPLNAALLAEVIDAVGLPAGVFNLVTGRGSVVGEALALHPGVDMVSFTGSTVAGRRVAEAAAGTIKKVALELGGKSANVLLDDADLQQAIKDGVAKCFLNSGQTCSALTRMLVPRARLAEAEQIATAVAGYFKPGDPFEPSTTLGPLVSESQRKIVRDYIAKGLDEGAKLLTGSAEAPAGLERGYFVAPTVFSEVTPEMTIAREEIFGPVLVLMPYEDEEDAVRIANDSLYGLAGGVWSADAERAKRVARRIRTGQVEINGGAFNPLAPFGGYKQSGYGRELGRYGLEEFLQVKALLL